MNRIGQKGKNKNRIEREGKTKLGPEALTSSHSESQQQARGRRRAMSEYVPDEVVVDILLRLPVKSLIRFRCVSKSWNSLIASPAFVHSHLNQSIPNNNNVPHPLLIVRHCSSSANRALDKEHYKLFYDNEAFEECAEFDFPTKSRSLKHFRLIASENGLIGLSEQERYILWNPSIRKCWNLPKPCITARKHGGSTCHEAFGFDPRTNDYKVVRIVIHHSTKEALVEEALVEVYCVSTCSWRLSSASLTPSTNFTDWRQPKACLKGSVHFAARRQRNGTGIGFVLAFDLRDEVFREMIFPHNMTRSNTDIVTCVFSGSLALLCYDEKRFSCSIWVMKEYGVVDSWVKQFTIDIAGGIEKNVLGFRKNGHIILETRKEVNYWELFSYDPESQQATKLEIQKNMHTFCVDTYRENLVLLNQANVVSRSRVTKKRKNRAKVKAEEHIEGKQKEQYKRLWDYCATVRQTNRGSCMLMKVERPSLKVSPTFQRLYMSLAACKDGFRQACRPVIGVDGCFIKGHYGGQLLAAVGRDPNDNIYPIAIAVVEAETNDSWSWFLETLVADLGPNGSSGWTFISDKQKGLIPSFEAVIPNAPHRICVRHLYANFKGEGHKGLLLKDKLWKAAAAYTVHGFQREMEALKKLSPTAHAYLENIDPHGWARAFFDTTPKCDLIMNILCKCFNSYIIKARDKPIITMLEMIRRKLMKRYQKKRQGIREYVGDWCPKILAKLELCEKDAEECTSYYAGEGLFEVECSYGQFVVDLTRRSCGCRQWDMTGIPCPHAISAILYNSAKPEQYLHQYYSVENYKKAYNPMIYPMPSKDQWVRTGQDEVDPPVVRATPRRLKKVRRRGPDEPKNPYCMRKDGVTLKCSECRGVGHNTRTCPRRKSVSTPSSSQRSVHTSTATELNFNDISSQPSACDSQPTQSPILAQERMHTTEENVSSPTKRQTFTTVALAPSKKIKLTQVQSKKSMLETVSGKDMHTSSSNVAAMGTQHSYAATKSKSTTVGARQKTLELKSGCVRPIRRSGRLSAMFKEANPNIEVPTVDLSCDDGELARTTGTVLGEPVRAVGIVIREPARTTRTSERVIVPTVEKGIQLMEAKKKGKIPIWQP